MGAKEDIDKAVGAHGMWKARLEMAITTGKSDFDPVVVKTDNNCEFGKWLHGTISPDLKSSASYPSIKAMHAEFHGEAGRILSLALSGKKAEAETAMGPTSEFSIISSKLSMAMQEWKKTVS